ncbi:hybrid sensor histidine kinase/response regulator [Salipiger mucosus]|uniref:histidine kinase n=1 Tax=Salipiger mucosus DSM 16094 TaxID=1123237 RepID=S9QNL2_9RHOB|nr:PAS-domain containing protein [Salipiger mucosus]EPX83026.1 Sensor histidine kinase/response regulator [Salipiger mucosus DSM 16094]
MSLAARLAEERRARLAAERLLELKQAELFAANRKLGKHARQLSHEITETRAEVAEVRNENLRVKTQLGAAHQKIELVEGQLWKALQTMRDGFALFSAERTMELANPAYLGAFEDLDTIGPGASFHHVLDMMVEEGIVDLQGEDGQAWRARMLARWQVDPIPTEIIRLWSGRFVKIEDRHLPDGGIVSLCVDITELMRMWSAIEELPDGFVIYDSDDRLLMCNAPYRRLYATSAPAIVPGAGFEDILRYGLAQGQYPEAEGREEAWLEERLEKHRGASQEIEQQLDDGRWLRVLERPLTDGGRVGLRIDITDMKRTQEELDQARQRAEIASRAKSTFLANMSHEIRTPMNGVVGMAELMMETDLTEEQRLYTQTIRNSGEALLAIINDILDYSKIEADKLTLVPEPFDLESAVHEVAMLLQPAARDKGIEILVDYDLFLPTRFRGDAGRVRQILTNLLGNAVKFTAQGHVLVRVTGRVGAGGETAVHMAVEDTGIGIEPEKLEHIFGEFNQVEDERNRAFEGTGLGLAITRRLVGLMGGELWVESAPGEGSCFGLRIVLPAEESEACEPRSLPEGLRRVLVLEDNPVTRSILGRQLAAAGLDAVFCASVADLGDGLRDAPDLVIAAQELAESSVRPMLADHDIPLVLMSSDPVGRTGAGAAEGSVTVLQKPAPCRALLAAMTQAFAAGGADRAPATFLRHPAPGPSPPTPAAAPLDVLVAEDNRTNQLVFRKMIERIGRPLDLRFADNGLEAIEAVRARRPDIVFMDISMPHMDGKQATREIRKMEGPGPRLPIIAVTAHAMTGDRDSFLEAGLDDYITKPVRKAALQRLLETWTVPGSQAG